ncbi:MAG: beta-lactamase family protein [Deltaproteobacteria bacterium]|nr:beta-lactamase family protein [Deltaproteobacteria bacterium]
MRHILRYVQVLWLVLVLGCSASSEPPEEPQTSPSDPAAQETETGEDDPWSDMTQFIEEQKTLNNIPGLAVALTRPGEVLWTAGFGLANRETGVPVTIDTPFMMASVSKTLTAVAVMQSQDDGELALDDNINTHLPFLVDNPRVEDEEILVRHLVSHTSGIRDNWSQMPYADGDSPHALGSYLEGYLLEGGAWFNATDNFYANMPGTVNEYGNIATALAGFVVESSTGGSFDDYCDEHIFDVLSMENTGWHLADFDPALVAMPYEYENGEHQAVGHYGYPDYPDGQLRSSVNDMARFLAAISNQGQLGEAQILTPQSVAEMFTPQFPSVDSGQFVFWYQSSLGDRTVFGHNGGDQGVATQILFSPESGIGVVVMLNTDWETAGEAPGAIMEALFERAEAN